MSITRRQNPNDNANYFNRDLHPEFVVLFTLMIAGCIILPIGYALIRKWYASYAIAISCGLATLLFFVAIEGLIPGVAWDSATGIVFSPSYLLTGIHLEALFLAIFLHANLIHLAFNVVALILFGIMLEERIGGWRLVVIFLSGGILGEVFFSIFNWGSSTYLLGASGGVMALIGAFARLYPYEKLNIFGLFLFLRNIEAWKVALLFVSIDLMLAIITSEVSFTGSMNIAYLAHVGGLLSGVILAPFIVKARITEHVDEIDIDALRKVIPDKKKCTEIESAIKGERERDIIDAWLKSIESVARCPQCKEKMRLRGSRLVCRLGHTIRISKTHDR